MKITLTLNGVKRTDEVAADLTLQQYLRQKGCVSVKCGCETGNCGLCTVHLDGKSVLSCTVLAARCDGRTVVTLEGVQEQAAAFGAFLADEGAEQCGHQNNSVGHISCKSHLVRHEDHGHAAFCQLFHHGEHLAHHFRIQRRGGFIEEHDVRIHS